MKLHAGCRKAPPRNVQSVQFQAAHQTTAQPACRTSCGQALKNWRTTTLAEALQPAIRLAEEGFNIGSLLAVDIQSARTSTWPETRAVFRPGGTPLPLGALLVQPDLGKTFRLIAEQGPDVFYHGEIADAIVQAQATHYSGNVANMGRMTLADLAAYNVVRRT
jgi:gamma-glutamyltranspeptidase/glutathione hydrolase